MTHHARQRIQQRQMDIERIEELAIKAAGMLSHKKLVISSRDGYRIVGAKKRGKPTVITAWINQPVRERAKRNSSAPQPANKSKRKRRI
jgi:hypothetical protein